MLKSTLKTLALSSIVATGFAATAQADAHAMNPMVGGAEMSPEMNIVENAMNSPIHTTLVAAVVAAEMAETLQGEGPFTVFAPTDEAFSAIPAETLEQLMMPENRAQLQQILGCHVVATEAFAADIIGMINDDGGMHPVPTVGGCTLQAQLDGDMVTLTDERGQVATVTIADVDQSNGVIHVIDTVLLPAE